ncbi:MAG: gliding motility-associated C-terminal domain-containing protein, partial [Cytophagaceae bacterium]
IYFRHIDTVSTAGCYAIKALNYYSLESEMSNKVCVDICVFYQLPNLITPNRDGMNDLFIPLPDPLNVEKVRFTVFNRWGAMVYYSEDDIYLNWGGVGNDGKELSEGVYYYNAEVTWKRRLKKEDQVKNIKGWVHIYDRMNLKDY